MRGFASIEAVQTELAEAGYVCGRDLATVVFLSLRLGRPLFLEGEAGVGKTEIAKAIAASLGRRLIRLQCYEGLDASSAVYEWNFPAQMVAIRTAEASGGADRGKLQTELFGDEHRLIWLSFEQEPRLSERRRIVVPEIDEASGHTLDRHLGRRVLGDDAPR